MRLALRVAGVILALLIGAAGALAVLLYAPELRERSIDGELAQLETPAPELNKAEADKQRARIKDMKRRLSALTPRRKYMVIDTMGNHFSLMKETTLLREGVCSTGSYVMLKSHDNREWIFRTPRGRYFVLDKRTSPVWSKPDWAFIEEGLPIPPAGASERYESNVLGDYALHIGDGYLIHGTLYQRLLGQPVTHGCIRLGDEDLEVVFKSLDVGSPVYIY